MEDCILKVMRLQAPLLSPQLGEEASTPIPLLSPQQILVSMTIRVMPEANINNHA